jgi:hypothetical protein
MEMQKKHNGIDIAFRRDIYLYYLVGKKGNDELD